MSTSTNWSGAEGRAEVLVRSALERLNSAASELVLDFSGVKRVDPAALWAMEELAAKARENSVKVVLRGVSVEVYKALKLAALVGQFSFAG